MQTELLSVCAQAMNCLAEVTWDRCVPRPDGVTTYGWIARADGKSDFVLLMILGQEVRLVTSSARYSAEFSRRLFGAGSAGHKDCERVEAVFGDLVERKS